LKARCNDKTPTLTNGLTVFGALARKLKPHLLLAESLSLKPRELSACLLCEREINDNIFTMILNTFVTWMKPASTIPYYLDKLMCIRKEKNIEEESM
jgi:hypothetical protein